MRHPLSWRSATALLQTWITDRDDLNEAEQENIVKGAAWARRRRGVQGRRSTQRRIRQNTA